MPVNTHNFITVTVNLDSPAAQQAGFNVLYIVPLAANSLNSAAYVAYTSYSDAVADNTAGYISATTLQALSDVFSQANVPATIYVASVDLVGGDAYTDTVTAMLAEGDLSFYAICVQDRTDAVITAVSAQVEALSVQKLFVCQSDDADWKTSGLPSGLTALDGRERTAVVYQSTDGEHNDLVYAADRLSFSPDDASVPWNGNHLKEVAANSTISSTEAAFLVANNANYGARVTSVSTFVMYPGYNQNGRQIAELVSADWFAIRLKERLDARFTERATRGQKWPVNATGVALVEAEMRALYAQGVQAGHFEADQFSFTSPTINADGTISAADITAQRIRATANIQLTTGALLIVNTGNLSRTAVNA